MKIMDFVALKNLKIKQLSFVIVIGFLFISANLHPYYISVANINHNAKEKTLEITYKIFTDDFEKALRNSYSGKINLTNPINKNYQDSVVQNYLGKHFTISVDNQNKKMNYLGFEEKGDGIISYFEIENIPTLKKLTVFNNVLYEMEKEQAIIIHSKANGIEKNTRMVNPTNQAILYY